MKLSNLLRTKTFWVGLLTIGSGIVKGIFDGNWSGAAEIILLGLAMITGREAILKAEHPRSAR